MGKFEIFVGRDGKFYFRLKAADGEIIATSEGYVKKLGAIDGISAVKNLTVNALVYDLTT